MTNKRITHHPILGSLDKQSTVSFTFDGKEYTGLENDTIASALMANGVRTLRKHEFSGNPRGIYCNIGHCFECRVTVNGEENIRACLTPIVHDMVVESGQVQPSPLDPTNEVLPKTYEDYEKMGGNQ